MSRFTVEPYTYSYATEPAYYFVWDTANSAQVGGNHSTRKAAQDDADRRNAKATAMNLVKTANWEEVGREAARNDEMAAPALNAQVMAAVGNNKVGDPETTRIMEAFSAGYDAERTAQADEAMHDMPVTGTDGPFYDEAKVVETPAAPQPRYVAVPSGMDLGFVAMVKDTRRDQTVPGSSVTNMEAAVQHAARLNALPKYFAGVEQGTGMWCVQENHVGGPRCSPRFSGPDAQAQAEAKADEMNKAEGLTLYKLDPSYALQRHADGQLYWLTEQEHADSFQPGPERRASEEQEEKEEQEDPGYLAAGDGSAQNYFVDRQERGF